MRLYNKWGLIIISYIALTIITYLTLTIYKLYANMLIPSLLFPLLLIIVAYLIFTIKLFKPEVVKGKVIRYTMHCLKCDWEWMSHTTEKAPNQCPNCHEKEKLEIIGWRNVNLPKMTKNRDLRGYFR